MINLARALRVPGWMTRTELTWLATQAQQARVIVECGSWQGRSTRALADHCRGVIYAIDPWEGTYYQENGTVHPIRTRVWPEFQKHLRDHLRARRVIARPGYSSTELPALLALIGPTADLVFIDGDHRYATCVQDLADAWPLVRAGGILAGHDYRHPDWPGVQQAVDERFPEGVQTAGQIWWVRKS